MTIFTKGSDWETSRVTTLEKSARRAWLVATAFGVCFVATAIALATLAPLRRTVPYLVKQDGQTGNIEVLQTFDNRVVGNQELMNKYWARIYVQAREQYNWYLVSADFDLVSRLTDSPILAEYADQFVGDKGMDKVFGNFTERRIKILSVTPSPVNQNQMVVRFERTTVSRGNSVEIPTIFVSNIAYRYNPKTFGAEADLIRNPVGYQVYAYRRDFETQSAPAPSSTPAS